MICKLFWGVTVKNIPYYRRYSPSPSEDEPRPIRSPRLFPPRRQCELCLDLVSKSHRGRGPGRTAGHSHRWPVYISSVYVLLFRYAGEETGFMLQWTAHSSRRWRERKRERECETALETERPMIDISGISSVNHNSSRDQKAAILNTQWARGGEAGWGWG